MNSTQIKDYLVKHFRARGVSTSQGDWKRLNKSKDDQDRAVREFSCSRIDGVVRVVENAGQLSLSFTPPSAPKDLQFNIPQFSEESLRAAARIRQHFIELAEDHELDIDPAYEIKKEPSYHLARPALATQLAFHFPKFTYENGELSSDISLDSPVGQMCVSILDPDPDAEPDLYHNNMIIDDWDRIGISSMDEDCFMFTDKEQSIRQAIQKLLSSGMIYDHARARSGDEGCLLLDQLSTLPSSAHVSFRAPRPGMS